jgi:type III restriction enzyme
VKRVKPFILVVCRDITHATDIYELIRSNHFFEGKYSDKVLQIDSSTRKDEDIEQQFKTLQDPANEIEIVIHVNMLKEGWDVSNLYTIVPLRAANAAVLVEQTIGRGLRLPYSGKRTGVDKVDKLTVVTHDNFDAVLAAAKDPNSILNKVSFIEIPKEELEEKTVIVTAPPVIQRGFEEKQKQIQQIADEQKRQSAQNNLDARKAIIHVLPEVNSFAGVHRLNDLRKDTVKKEVLRKISENLSKGQGNLFAEQIIAEADEVYQTLVTEYENHIIEIPRMDLVPGDTRAYFKDFDLDTSEITYEALDQEIFRIGLIDNISDTLAAHSSGYFHKPEKIIISELINYPEIDYDENADLLHKLAKQAIEGLKKKVDDSADLSNTVFQFKAAIAEKIYAQMHAHFELEDPGYIKPKVLPFVNIEAWNFSTLIKGGYRDYREVIQPVSLIPKLVFRGFQKACHFEYKFDSKTEQDMAFILEHDQSVVKWMRPAPNQFHIYWNHNSLQYRPDFIVETMDTIYMLEPKRADQLNSSEVQAKKNAAEKYCEYASQYTKEHGGKTWKYGLIPHDGITRTSSLAFLVARFS